ncbi:pathogen-related protein-like [Acanthaster planci]|uniref:Pathogen-related protein-like n=1 Tax=Acanthaster planci TaxID=133434 RepID=A0A8B7ZB88_ACAPL|nr:pathogen-related protein-like [Acanthaster planci]
MSSANSIDQELKDLAEKYGFMRPDRGDLDDPSIPWKNDKPDYCKADLLYFKGKTMNHKPGSLEMIVENLVKKWEMEASHLPDYTTWTTINAEKFKAQANGQKFFSGEESSTIGNYNWLLSAASKDLYDSEQHSFESSHDVFREAFPDGFAWELLQVFSGPPKVVFSWRHWANFTGKYKGRVGEGQLIEMHGFAVATVDEQLLICQLEVYYKPDEFLKAMEGKIPLSNLSKGKEIFGPGCPIHREK